MATETQLEDFSDLYNFVAEQANIDVAGSTESLNKVKRLVNISYDMICSAFEWWFLQKQLRVNLVAPYTTGTVDVTKESASITGNGTAWSTNLAAKAKFKVDGDSEIYPVQSIDSETAITLGVPGQTITYKGDTASASGYTIWTDVYALPSDFKEMLQPHHAFWPYYPQPLGIREFRRVEREYGSTTGKPEYYTLESDEDGTQSIIIRPFPDVIATLEADYILMVTALSADTDKPLIPRDYIDIIAWKALQSWFQGERNDMERANYFGNIFETRRMRMLTDHKSRAQEDLPMLRPSMRRYRRYSRRFTSIADDRFTARTAK